ncbi:MAG: hypothetical protein OCD01_12590 [Fibrobacterales bacterium]
MFTLVNRTHFYYTKPPYHHGIFTTHEYLLEGDRLGTGGGDIWDEVINPNPNVFMVHCGHYGGIRENLVVTNNDAGKPVYQILSDYQSDDNGGNGFLRLYTFRPSLSIIEVSTYSPSLNEFEKDNTSRFDINFPFSL